MADRVEIAFRRAAVELIPAGGSVLAAVSGGGDSVALLHLLHRFCPRRGVQLVVGHLDHGLRRGSRTDRAFVERLARDLGLACVAGRLEVGKLRRRSESPEEAARRVRRGFLLEAAGRAGCARIATGHTLDDQAETVLMRLVRGAGAAALGGMSASGPGPFVRPLLALERSDLRGFLRRRGHAHREDPSNQDLRFDRNRVRRLVLPLLTESLNPRAAKNLVKAVGMFREDAEHLDALAVAAFAKLSRRDRSGRVVLDARRWSATAPAVAKRVARLALREAGADPRHIATRHIEALLDLARGGGGRRLHLPTGVTARRDQGRVLLGKD
jgi:tRNA(Ile)-lysidine synthetase-like protein